MQPLQPLPKEARDVLEAVDAPPRLLAHLALVHAVAIELVDGIAAEWPRLPIDRHAVLVGAATHDIGKTLHRDELYGPGRQHENDGPSLLIAHGFPEDLARFARTHGQWALERSPQIEDLLVALANLIWVGQRNERLEDLIVNSLVKFSGEPLWSAYARFDAILLAILEGAGQRLAIYTKIVADEDKRNNQQ
jgi:hypothetical protein